MKNLARNPKSALNELTSFVVKHGVLIEDEGIVYSSLKNNLGAVCDVYLQILFPVGEIEWINTPGFLDKNGNPRSSRGRIFNEENILSFITTKKLYVYCLKAINVFPSGRTLVIRGVFQN